VDSRGRTIWIADAHRDDGQRFIVRADEKLTAFVELKSAIRASSGWLQPWIRWEHTVDPTATFVRADGL
jgi:hypothetical protein